MFSNHKVFPANTQIRASEETKTSEDLKTLLQFSLFVYSYLYLYVHTHIYTYAHTIHISLHIHTYILHIHTCVGDICMFQIHGLYIPICNIGQKSMNVIYHT